MSEEKERVVYCLTDDPERVMETIELHCFGVTIQTVALVGKWQEYSPEEEEK
jgi:hypothetical protein